MSEREFTSAMKCPTCPAELYQLNTRGNALFFVCPDCGTIADDSAGGFLRQMVPKVVAERDALLKFKQWVHAYLDNIGVPHDPDAEHTAQHGCRISGRMNHLKAQRDELLAHMREAVENCELCRGLAFHGTARCCRCKTFVADIVKATGEQP
jgi:predicted RNA-binding Zn-ribbon protein involved in translation (DUF1610 family)